MSHLSEKFICEHCGERLIIEDKKNKVGDAVRRGICPTTTSSLVSIEKHTATPWELVTRAALKGESE